MKNKLLCVIAAALLMCGSVSGADRKCKHSLVGTFSASLMSCAEHIRKGGMYEMVKSNACNVFVELVPEVQTLLKRNDLTLKCVQAINAETTAGSALVKLLVDRQLYRDTQSSI